METMELIFKVGAPHDFGPDAKAIFLNLLKKQGQNDHPSEQAVDACACLCMVHAGNEVVGIGAIKELYRLAFDYSGLKKRKHEFEAELGYLFVNDAASGGNFRNLGIGKTITRLLLKALGNENVFASTEYSPENPMLYILKSLGFKRRGRIYEGTTTGKKMGLMLKFKTL